MKRFINTLLLFNFILFSSCLHEDFLEENPRDIISANNLYRNYDGFQAGINGLYAYVIKERNGPGNTGNYAFNIPTMQGLDISYGTRWGGGAFLGFIDLHLLNSEVGEFGALFEWLYQVVNAANTIIERAENADVDWQGTNTAEDEARKNRVLAEARTIRAWSYRHLTNLWNDVPLTTKESTGADLGIEWRPTPRIQVEEQMEADWLFAMEHLPEVQEIPGRISQAVPMHYLAELYLIWGQYSEAESMALNLINNGNFSLVTERYGIQRNQPGTPFTDMFIDGNVSRNQGNTEVLWSFQREFQVIGGENRSNMRRLFNSPYDIKFKGVSLQVTVERGGRGLSAVSLTKWAIENFGDNDDRGGPYALRKYYIIQPGDRIDAGAGYALGDTLWLDWSEERMVYNNSGWPSITKYDWALEQNVRAAQSFKDEIYLRLGETYLLLAEAQIMQGKNTEAAETINVLRRRANAPEITSSDVSVDFLLDERARELLFEEHRKYVLVRHNKYVERVRAFNPTVSSLISEQYHYLPVPQRIIDSSPGYPQNPGY
ncbi:RagB/SusD family nutrient uptake outer membrane protein [Lunatimonas salinarum]|uniref:RagB/SusD family nutrient uptake outer membrane protein n=1 Tax=Lunatimonas salinarum TaxID=1774590 RepID=UPI001ADF8819|nr:RagB/SusD family nutrient uptake outer membrane protein [Lunatimonas salinarum]